MTCALMELQPVILGSQNAMNAVDGATIERRIRINRPDEGRGRCKGSRAWDPRKDFSQCMQQHKIPSTSNVILPQQERTEPSGHRPCRHGATSSLRREPDVPRDLLRAIFGNVTEPSDVPEDLLRAPFANVTTPWDGHQPTIAHEFGKQRIRELRTMGRAARCE